MKQIFLSPHDDDESLFGAYICLREKPLVVFCFDSYVQPNRGDLGCSAAERAKESENACKILDCDSTRLNIRDDISQPYKELVEKLRAYEPDIVYAPMKQRGNPHHDLVNEAAHELWPDIVIEYATYTKTQLYTTGTIEVKPTDEEKKLKKEAMACHVSQMQINAPHFEAVLGKSEWIISRSRLHLGCGRNLKKGWVNLDMMDYADVQHDVTKGPLPFEDNTFDYVFSEDFLEHLPQETKIPIMNEIWRVLKPGGFMEHFIPNAGSRNDFGSPSHLSHWNLQQFEHFDIDSYRYHKDHEYEGFNGAFKKVFTGLLSWDADDNKHQSLQVKYQAIK